MYIYIFLKVKEGRKDGRKEGRKEGGGTLAAFC
jgi:hypothetical protein